MCGRIFQIHNIGQLLQYTRAAKIRNAASFNPTYNQGPTNYIAAIREYNDEDANWQDPEENVVLAADPQIKQQVDYAQEQIEKEPETKPKRGLDFMKWGYQTKFNMILNARIEEMHEKHTYKKLLNTRRCVVIADGYYEWDTKKQPFKYENVNQKPLLMAAMYSDDDEVFVLTRDSFGDFQKVHHRMPVLLDENEIDLWIDCKNNYYDIVDNRILNQQKKIWTSIQSVMVGPAVNSMKEKSEKCIMTMEEYKATQFNKGLGRFFSKKPIPKAELETQESEDLKSQFEKVEKSLD